jgi:hypothetical protein
VAKKIKVQEPDSDGLDVDGDVEASPKEEDDQESSEAHNHIDDFSLLESSQEEWKTRSKI